MPHVSPAREFLFDIDAAEPLLVPFGPCRCRDARESDRHERVPLPPRELPARRERRDPDGERLGEKGERERNHVREARPPAPPYPEVRERRVGVGEDAAHGGNAERRADLIRCDRIVQRRRSGERDSRPDPHHGKHECHEPRQPPYDSQGRRMGVLDG